MTIVLDDMENVNREKKMKSSMDGIHARQVFHGILLLCLLGQQLPGADCRIVDGVPDSLGGLIAQALEFPKNALRRRAEGAGEQRRE